MSETMESIIFPTLHNCTFKYSIIAIHYEEGGLIIVEIEFQRLKILKFFREGMENEGVAIISRWNSKIFPPPQHFKERRKRLKCYRDKNEEPSGD